jgi:hypothetical protein
MFERTALVLLLLGLGEAHARDQAYGRKRKNGVMESRFHRYSLGAT